ncbi:amidohydrolase family protein [Saccharopolyspora hattusasensis]|uniref:amidohydrolase family protein n=1 Tax=Saccharopolyspora hattusasensis TaxID=1128679 RepID=UPI003D96DC12
MTHGSTRPRPKMPPDGDSFVLRSGWVATMAAGTGDLPGHDVRVEDGVITGIGPDLDSHGLPSIDARGCLVLPGLVDTHRHTWETLVRGVGADWLQGHYFAGIHRGARLRFTPDDVRLGTLLGLLDALDEGVTTVVDWSHIIETAEHAAAAVDAITQAGPRVVFGFGGGTRQWQDLPSPIPLDADLARRIRAEHFAVGPRSLHSMAIAARGPEFSDMTAVEHDWRLADELDLPISVHVGGGLKALTYRPIARLRDHGLLRPGTTYIHGNHLSDEDWAHIAGSGGHVSLVPEVDLMMGIGDLPTNRVRAAGLQPSLSTDEVASGSGSLMTAIRTVLAAERARANGAALRAGRSPATVTLTAREALEFATVGGAAACGLADRTGSLVPGKDADLLVVNLGALKFSPVNDPVDQFILSGDRSDVEAVAVRGRFLKYRGKLVQRDRGVLDAAASARDRIFRELGKQVGRHWLPRDLDAPDWFTTRGAAGEPAAPGDAEDTR